MWFTEIAQVKNPGHDEMHRFIQGVERFQGFVLEQQQDFRFLWADDPELHDMAWEKFKMDVVEGAGAMHTAIDTGLSTKQVINHGLTGRPMHFKLRVLDSIARRWKNFGDQFKAREWLKRMFEAIDAILDSLIEAAGGAGGLIKEFKDVLSALATTA